MDVSDFSARELGALVGLCGARAVARGTGLPIGLLVAVAPGADTGRRAALSCEDCGQPMEALARRRRRPLVRCRGCGRERIAERMDRARTLLAARVPVELAAEALAAREGISESTAVKVLRAVRREAA